MDAGLLPYAVTALISYTGTAALLRRRIREIFRLSQGKMKQGYDIIVVARTRAAHADYWELKRAFEKTCKKLGLWEAQA